MRTVLLVEDNEYVSKRLIQTITAHRELSLLSVAGNCEEARRALQKCTPHVMLVDLGLPDGSGLDLIRETSRGKPDVHILVVTVFSDKKYVLPAIEHGAAGYLLKDAAPEQVIEAIMQVLDGGSPISPSVACHLFRRFREDSHAPATNYQLLTGRECDVLRLIAKGCSYSETGETLNMSINTVASHIKQIYRKLAVHSRSEAVFEAAERGLITMPR